MDSATTPAGGGFRQFGTKFYRYKSLLKRNWWVLALTAAAGLAYQGWVVYSKPQQFESAGKMTIREELNNSADGKKYNLSIDQFVGTSLAVMKGDEVSARVQRRLALEAPELAGAPVELSSSVLPRSYLFTITARSSRPEVLPKFVDLAREEFIALRDEQRLKVLESANSTLADQRRELEATLKGEREQLKKFIQENNMSFWAEQAQNAASYLSGLKTRQGALETELRRMETMTPEQMMFVPAQTAMRAPGGGSSSAPMASELSSLYFQRMQELTQAEARLKERSTVWRDKHPRLQQMKETVNELRSLVESIQDQNKVASAQRVEAIKADLKGLEQSTVEWEKKIQEAGAKDAELKMLEAKVKQTEESLDRLRIALEELAPGVSKSDIFVKLGQVTPAMEVPKGLSKHLVIGLIGGLVCGIAILIFRDRADDRLASSTEMMEQFNEPILGQIPDVMATRDANGLPLLQPEDERYSFAEAFRSLRSSLIFMPNQQHLQTLLVTSAIPNEGKSTITSNLGITMAAAGANVMLVDADLRRGDLASLFDMDGRTGLSNVLRGEVKWQDAIQTTKYPGLTLLPRGPVTNQSSELLLKPSLEAMLDEMKSEYDLVLFNTAPILATDDTSSLSPHFDGTLMVVRAQFTSARLTHNALNALYQRQVNVLGLILNCVDTEMPDYYYYRYPKYYAAK